MSKPSSRSRRLTDSYRRRKPQPLFQPRVSSESATSTHTTSSHPTSHRADALVKLGIDAYQSRRLEDASAYLTNAVKLQPEHALAHNCLGVVRRAQGRLAEAIACYEQSIRDEPYYPEAHNNLGVACEAAGDFARAIASYESALRIKPDFAAAENNLGSVLTKSGRAEAALEHLHAAIRIQPALAAAHNNLGLALSHLNRWAEAEQSFRRALELRHGFPEACVNLGNVLRAAGRIDAAGECFRLAIRQQAEFAAAHVGLGNVLYDQQQLPAALTEYQTALGVQPQSAEAHFGVGNVHSSLGHDDEATAAWRHALELRPGYAEALNNLGVMYHRQGHTVLAEKEFLDALRSKPDLLAAHNNLGNLYREQDRMDLAAASYRQILNRQAVRPLAKLRLSTLCPAVWTGPDQIAEYTARVEAEWTSLRGAHAYQDLPDLLSVANEPPYNLQFLGTNIRPLKEAYANIFRYTGPSFRPRPRSGKIKFGAVVTQAHEVAFLRLIWGALKRLDPDEFDRTILCSKSGSFLLQSALRDDDARIVELPDQPHQVVHSIRELQLDVLYYFEVCTDAMNYFLPFFRLAPVQVTSWGIQVTSGIPTMDAYLSSGVVEGDDAQNHYSERLLQAATLLTYQTPISPPSAGKTREAFGFSADQNLYSCVQHLGKFHPDFDPLLADILRQDPRGIVVATQDKHGYGAQRLRERFARTMPDVADRIVFLPRQGFEDYVRLAAISDVMLDPIHFGGVTTTYDSLSLNKPIVTLPSSFHRGRYTFGCYRRMGVLDCVAANASDYARIAVRLGTDADWRSDVSTRIRDARWRIFEDQQAISEHERLFQDLVERSRQG